MQDVDKETADRIEQLERLLQNTIDAKNETIKTQRKMIDEMQAAFEQVINLDRSIKLFLPELGELALVFIKHPRRVRTKGGSDAGR